MLRRDSRLKLIEQKCTYPLGFAPPSQVRDGGYWAVLAG